MTDDAGDVEASFRYDVFGAVRVASGSTDLEFRFTGGLLPGIEQHSSRRDTGSATALAVDLWEPTKDGVVGSGNE